jgi:hypothetical protein
MRLGGCTLHRVHTVSTFKRNLICWSGKRVYFWFSKNLKE